METAAPRFSRWSIGEKRLVIVQRRPGPLVDPEVMQTSLAERRLILAQLRQHGVVAAPILREEKVVDAMRRRDQLLEGLAIGLGQFRGIHAKFNGRETGTHALQFAEVGQGCNRGCHQNNWKKRRKRSHYYQ